METLARRYQIDLPIPARDLHERLALALGESPGRPQEPQQLFQTAIEMEQRAEAFFTESARRCVFGSAAQQLFEQLAAEEREHAALLSAELQRWRHGEIGRLGLDPARRPGPSSQATQAALKAAPLMNAASLLLQDHDALRPALRCGDQSMNRGELRDAVARCAALWRALGVAPGDRVAIKLSDGCDWVVAFLGTIWAGAVAVAVNPRIPSLEWQYILDEAGFHSILCEPGDDAPTPWQARRLQVEVWREQLSQHAPAPATMLPPDAPALWCHSSGTSGRPKAVVHAQRFAQAIEQVSREGLGLRCDDRLFASSKLFFAYPQTNSLFVGLKLGATVLLDAQWPTAAGVTATVEAQRPSVLFSVPSLYRNLLHEELAPRIAAAGVRLCVSAGEALPASLRQAWRARTGLNIVNGYGASEMMVLVMLDQGDEAGLQASPGIEVAPLEPNATTLPTRLRFRLPTLALGYLDRPQAQAESFRDGGFCPADLFLRTEAGGWRFAGREDSLVKIAGRWVNLVELEERLMSQSTSVVEGAAVCVPDSDGVDSVAFFFVADDAAGARRALDACAQTLPHHQRPRWTHALEALPRTPTGKLLRRKLRELHLSRC